MRAAFTQKAFLKTIPHLPSFPPFSFIHLTAADMALEHLVYIKILIPQSLPVS